MLGIFRGPHLWRHSNEQRSASARNEFIFCTGTRAGRLAAACRCAGPGPRNLCTCWSHGTRTARLQMESGRWVWGVQWAIAKILKSEMGRRVEPGSEGGVTTAEGAGRCGVALFQGGGSWSCRSWAACGRGSASLMSALCIQFGFLTYKTVREESVLTAKLLAVACHSSTRKLGGNKTNINAGATVTL